MYFVSGIILRKTELFINPFDFILNRAFCTVLFILLRLKMAGWGLFDAYGLSSVIAKNVAMDVIHVT